ncbi:hypothetical protein AC578_8365 [Pseudocercospora eumusae]|uniref:Uncharacterized protein n=1 Tax=Pseudocercospora eumusae TaxID=321146 RepID=A0A139HRU8_9PEZI|nr:hypothetical protein AC578_8365 [Pseudocercospora eumusae]
MPANCPLDIPPEHDLFSPNPAMRLSDCTEKLGEYKEKRMNILANATKTQHLQESVRNNAWEEAWSQLKEDLSKA